MKTEIKEIYKCEHCNKLYQVKRFCIQHEISCTRNPDNHRACHECIHIDKVGKTIYVDIPGCGEQSQRFNLLYCNKLNHFLYPPKVEHKGNWIETDPQENKPMPKECDQQKLYPGIDKGLKFSDL